ncbi:hypothetical protein [Planctomyces sp. SH-PL14]|uniref:hypothetical protein n=1 Tax=Planctomyces sp. SH-PL14 TaxID=1632864 RepID=UPI00078E96C0|nr:hypothetical protein [Planctomyces sp. SH-PL14]AMV20630.1 hypothetical protein VT03_22210 [Planctomyces sp. SH-PL14]
MWLRHVSFLRSDRRSLETVLDFGLAMAALAILSGCDEAPAQTSKEALWREKYEIEHACPLLRDSLANGLVTKALEQGYAIEFQLVNKPREVEPEDARILDIDFRTAGTANVTLVWYAGRFRN